MRWLPFLLAACSQVDRAGEICDDDDDGFVEDRCAAETEYPAGDCDDANAAVYPGSVEVCNGLDDDCDGILEDDEATDRVTWYRDADADGAGDPATTLLSCAAAPTGYVAVGDDCNDHDVGVQQLTFFADVDDDEHGDPDASTLACAAPDGFVTVADDCDDTDRKVSPEAIEICENGVDDDCEGTSAGCGLNGEMTVGDADAVVRGSAAAEHFGYQSLRAADLDDDGNVDLLGDQSLAYGPLFQDRDAVPLQHADFGVDRPLTTTIWGDEVVVGFFYGTHALKSYVVSGRTLQPGAISIGGDDLGQTLVPYRSGLAATDFRNDRSVYVFLDPAAATSTDAPNTRLTSTSSTYGLTVASGGDLDGDGLDDLVVGAYMDRVIDVYFDLPSGSAPHEDARDVTIAAPDSYGGLFSLADADADGRAELYVGQPSVDASSGRITRLRPSRSVVAMDETADAVAQFLGPAGSYSAGVMVVLPATATEPWASLVAASSMREAGRGGAVLFRDIAADGVYEATSADAILTTSAVENLGSTVANLGDIDGDGYTDIAIGAGRASPNGTDSGAAYVFLGSGL